MPPGPNDPPDHFHLAIDSAERYAVLEPYWERVPMDLFAIHLQGVESHAHSVRHSHPLYQKEAKRARSVYDRRLAMECDKTKLGLRPLVNGEIVQAGDWTDLVNGKLQRVSSSIGKVVGKVGSLKYYTARRAP